MTDDPRRGERPAALHRFALGYSALACFALACFALACSALIDQRSTLRPAVREDFE